MSGFDQLYSELQAAERRTRTSERPTGVSRPSWPGRLALAAGAGVAVAVAAIVIVLAGHRSAGRREPVVASPALPATVRTLIGELGVLRAPQTAAARRWMRTADFRRLLRPRGPIGAPIRSLTRAVALPGHGIIYLYVVGKPGERITGVGYEERTGPHAGTGGCCIIPASLRRPTGPGPLSYQSGRIPPQLYFEVVPDGVTQVRWTFAPGGNFREFVRSGHVPASHIVGSAPTTVTVPVHSNVAAMKLPNRGAALATVWLDRSGRVIARRGPG